MAFQTKSNKKNELLKITPCKSFSIKPTFNQSLESLVKPAPPNEKFPSYKAPSSLIDLSSSCTADCLWGLCQVIQRDDICLWTLQKISTSIFVCLNNQNISCVFNFMILIKNIITKISLKFSNFNWTLTII